MERRTYLKEEIHSQILPKYRLFQRRIAQRGLRKEVWCNYCKTKGHLVSNCPEVEKLEEQCTALSEALELALKILKDIIDSKSKEIALLTLIYWDVFNSKETERKSTRIRPGQRTTTTQNVYKADIVSTSKIRPVRLQYSKNLITEFRDPVSKKWTPDEKLKKRIAIKRDVNKEVKVKKDKPELSNWHQRSVEKGNIKGYLKAQARIGLCCKNKSRAKNIYDQKLNKVPEQTLETNPSLINRVNLDGIANIALETLKINIRHFSVTDASIIDEVNRVKLGKHEVPHQQTVTHQQTNKLERLSANSNNAKVFKGSIKNTREIKVKTNAPVGCQKSAEMNCANEIESKRDNYKAPIYYQKVSKGIEAKKIIDPGCQDSIEIKTIIEASKLDNESGYEKIAPNPISNYLEEPGNADNDAETCSETGDRNNDIETMIDSEDNKIIGHTERFISSKNLPSRNNENKAPINYWNEIYNLGYRYEHQIENKNNELKLFIYTKKPAKADLELSDKGFDEECYGS
ncbi:hypothetical protein C2G38_2199960 [Gigaspora rosea]|uniref:CCHC-type domain-containing protein n=1 Tax=Gigaspora rosea TaxID=44941 RepID=A0A397UZW7_9GLOM|nr:hypothetical protein C2G38_2199960 [Gigaspora rosea]